MIKMTVKEFNRHRYAYDGYCLHCKDITRIGGTEPDAENYHCEECETNSCIGMDYALAGDNIEITGE